MVSKPLADRLARRRARGGWGSTRGPCSRASRRRSRRPSAPHLQEGGRFERARPFGAQGVEVELGSPPELRPSGDSTGRRGPTPSLQAGRPRGLERALAGLGGEHRDAAHRAAELAGNRLLVEPLDDAADFVCRSAQVFHSGMARMPERPVRSAVTIASASCRSAESAPKPVMTTRLFMRGPPYRRSSSKQSR